MGARALQRPLTARSGGGTYAKVIGVVVLVAIIWLGGYWWGSMRQLEIVQLRSRVGAMMKVADKCRAAVEEYYAQRGRMPRSDEDVSCTSDTPHAAKPRVAAGVVTVEAAGQFSEALQHKKSGTTLQYAPQCDTGFCVSTPIVSWNCSSGTTIEAIYRPAACR